MPSVETLSPIVNFMFLFLFWFVWNLFWFGYLGCLEILCKTNVNEINNLQVIMFKVLTFLKSNHTMSLIKRFILHNSKPPDFFPLV